jgi:hypothetical protein
LGIVHGTHIVNSVREPRLPRLVEAYSFDLSGTLLERRLADRKDLFLEVDRRLLGVENTLKMRHPVCGPGVIPFIGFGPVEGPNQESQLPRFFRACEPCRSPALDPPETGSDSFAMEISNYRVNQALASIISNPVIAEIDIPKNFGDVGSDGFRAVVQSPENGRHHHLEIRARRWSPDERPLAAIYNPIEPRDCPNATFHRF